MKRNLHILLFSLFSLCMHAQVTNDECSTAMLLTPTQGVCNMTGMSFDGATVSTEEDVCVGELSEETTNADLWFQFTATNNQHWMNVFIDCPWSLYTGECGNLSQICIENENSENNNLIHGLVIGQTYYLRVYVYVEEGNGFAICLGANEDGINIDVANYSNEELVTDMLFDSACTTFTNITASSGVDFGSENSIGAFQRNAAMFPFDKGVVLSTGKAEYASTAGLTYNGGIASWTGDDYIETILEGLGYPEDSYNASSLEFDFVAHSNSISFDYFFTSTEYGVSTQCSYGDAFAILLTDTETGETINIAKLPGTEVPISTYTIRGTLPECIGMNTNYFTSTTLTGFNFTHRSVPLTATGELIPNHLYHVKIVIADGYDKERDSAVFLSSGKFSIVSPDNDSGYELLSDNYTYVCSNTPTTLTAATEPGFDFQWSKDGVEIQDATEASYAATEPGTYNALVSYPGEDINCGSIFEITLTAIDVDPVVEDITVEDFTDNDGFHTFDLQAISDTIMEQNNFDSDQLEIYFYSSEDSAIAGTGDSGLIYNSTPFTNTSNPQNLFVRTEFMENNSFCYSVTPITFTVLVTPPAPIGEDVQYFFDGATLDYLIVNGENIQWYSTAEDNEPLSLTTSLINGVIYYASQTVQGIESTTRLAITAYVTSAPPTGEPEQLLEEGSTLADIEIDGQNIQWYNNPGATIPGPPDNMDTPLPITTILVDGETYYASQTIDGIESIQRTAVTITLSAIPVIPAPDGPSDQSFSEGETLADLEVTGQNITWYSTMESDEILPMTTLLNDGVTYYASQKINDIESTERLGVTVHLTLNADDHVFSGFKFFPNPIYSTLNLKNLVQIEYVAIYNTLGQKIFEQIYNDLSLSIDLFHLQKGIYLLEVGSARSVKTIKIIKE